MLAILTNCDCNIKIMIYTTSVTKATEAKDFWPKNDLSLMKLLSRNPEGFDGNSAGQQAKAGIYGSQA